MDITNGAVVLSVNLFKKGKKTLISYICTVMWRSVLCFVKNVLLFSCACAFLLLFLHKKLRLFVGSMNLCQTFKMYKMKKLFVLGLALCSVFAFTSCKSSKSEYKKAYDQAQQLELAQGQGQANEAIEIAPVTTTTQNAAANVDTSFRTEKVVLASGAEGSLKDFSVVCGSFGRKEGAESVKAALIEQGYKAIIVQNPETGMYRVVCGSFDNKQQAAEYREQFKANNPDNADFQKAWLLYNK